jgi:DnaJ family protein A protein 1
MGRKIIKEKKVLEVHVDKGMKDGQQVRFTAEGDQQPGVEPGDVVVILDEKAHPVFKRQKADLVMNMQIDLVDALCGFQKTIDTMDGRTLVVTSLPGEVVKHGDLRCIMGEGMPQYRNPFEKGRLIISFNVRFPANNWLGGADVRPKLKRLEALLPAKEEALIPDGAEECDLHEVEPDFEPGGRHRGRMGEAYESDDEDGGMHGGQRVQCAQH